MTAWKLQSFSWLLHRRKVGGAERLRRLFFFVEHGRCVHSGRHDAKTPREVLKNLRVMAYWLHAGSTLYAHRIYGEIQ